MRLGRKGGLVLLGGFLILVLASVGFAICKQNVYIQYPDGSSQVCEWVCTLPGGGLVTAGCTSPPR
jgi:hypothetical protein